jgi:hypothetical protein
MPWTFLLVALVYMAYLDLALLFASDIIVVP